jgi:hypothetical protein
MTSGDELTGLVDRLRWDRRRNPYAGRRDYSQAAGRLADRCARLIEAGQAGVAVPVLRNAVDRITTALMYLDDSSGRIGGDLHEIMSLYAQACRAAPPNPKTLAAWLVKLQCDGPGWPEIRLAEFAPALGERGLAHLASLVEQRHAAAEEGSWTQRFAVRDLREQLAGVADDVDRYVAVVAENLTGPHRYRRIAEALRAAGRPEQAVGWARRGLADGRSGPYADELRDLLGALLVEVGDHVGAVDERRVEFVRRPTARNWHALSQAATTAGVDPDLAWALSLLQERAAEQPAYVSELIDVLLAERREDQAWQVGLAHFAQLPQHRRAALLELRQAAHPGEVQQPYRQLIEEHLLDSRDKRRYQRAIALLRRLRDAHRATGDLPSFDAYLTDLRTRHKRRPTFLAKLDAARL